MYCSNPVCGVGPIPGFLLLHWSVCSFTDTLLLWLLWFWSMFLRPGGVNPLTFVFSFNTVFAILGLSPFHVSFQAVCQCPQNKCVGFLLGFPWIIQIKLGRIDILTILSSCPWTWDICPFMSLFDFFHQNLYFSHTNLPHDLSDVYISILFFGTNASDDVFQIANSTFSLLLVGKRLTFLFLYTTSLL